jgi:gas vesicle protein
VEVDMTEDFDREETYGSAMAFFTGLVAGAMIGAGLGMLYAPRRGSELRRQMADSATKVSQGVSKTVDEWTEQGRAVYDRVRDVANRAGNIVERMTGEAVKAADSAANTANAAAAAARSMYAGTDRN